MKKTFITISIIAVSLLLAIPAYSRNINLPFNESLDTNNYSDIATYYSSDGSTFEHRTSGCWSGGCARFTPPTTQTTVQSRRAGLGNFDFGEQSTIYVRFLMRMSSNFEEDVMNRGYGMQDKHIIFDPAGGSRGMSILEACTNRFCRALGKDYYTPGACEDNSCTYEGDTEPADRPCGDDAFQSEDYEEEWWCFEIMYDTNANITRIYVTTQDGALSGLYMERSGINIDVPRGVQGIGWYFNGYYSGSAWFELDEIAIDDEYIGPPDGFLNSSIEQPGPPQNLKIID